MGWDGRGWEGMGWDGMGRHGMGWDGMGWGGMGGHRLDERVTIEKRVVTIDVVEECSRDRK
jgi:hypothetical protein